MADLINTINDIAKLGCSIAFRHFPDGLHVRMRKYDPTGRTPARDVERIISMLSMYYAVSQDILVTNMLTDMVAEVHKQPTLRDASVAHVNKGWPR